MLLLSTRSNVLPRTLFLIVMLMFDEICRVRVCLCVCVSLISLFSVVINDEIALSEFYFLTKQEMKISLFEIENKKK